VQDDVVLQSNRTGVSLSVEKIKFPRDPSQDFLACNMPSTNELASLAKSGSGILFATDDRSIQG
jgi:hypothetical protein